MCLWPGLTRLWFVGEWSGLLTAVSFAAALNVALIVSFLAPGFVPAAWRGVGWIVLACIWVFSVVRAARGGSQAAPTGGGDERGLFLHAQGEYLRGRWNRAEALLEKLLRDREEDADARLMLATLYRRTRRIEEARSQLRILERSVGAEKWRFEMEREEQILRRMTDSCVEETQVTQSS